MSSLKSVDPVLDKLIKQEAKRQAETLMMIPSENHTSQAVRKTVGSLLQDKYCEGYPDKRYYQGQKYFDQLETFCQDRVKKAFGVPYANVQALSGAPANSAIYFALLNYGDTLMGMALDQGGHISHGLKLNFSGKYFKSIFYQVNKKGLIDYQAMEKLAKKERPKIIIAGITSYPRTLNFRRFAQIAKKVDAYLMADVAHVAGLILAGVYPNPVPYCHIINTTTHKTLRGARGALIMVTKKGLRKDPDLPVKIDRAVFPGLQGGPHMNNIAGIAVALKEASKPSFKKYGRQVVENATTLAKALKKHGFNLVSGGTDSHLILINLQNFDILGKTAAWALEEAGIILNYNAIPYDPQPPFYASGIRLGTPGVTSRGMKEKEMEKIGLWIHQVIEKVSQTKKQMKINTLEEREKETRLEIIAKTKTIKQIKSAVKDLCRKFPILYNY